MPADHISRSIQRAFAMGNAQRGHARLHPPSSAIIICPFTCPICPRRKYALYAGSSGSAIPRPMPSVRPSSCCTQSRSRVPSFPLNRKAVTVVLRFVGSLMFRRRSPSAPKRHRRPRWRAPIQCVAPRLARSPRCESYPAPCAGRKGDVSARCR